MQRDPMAETLVARADRSRESRRARSAFALAFEPRGGGTPRTMELNTAEPTDLTEALAESENRFRCLVEYASDAYLLYDQDADCST